MEKLIVEISNIKTHLNNTELQLYEANEKMSELIETVSWPFQFIVERHLRRNASQFCLLAHKNPDFFAFEFNFFYFLFLTCVPLPVTTQHHHIQEENESLKVENSNLTKVAQLMTHSMKESVDTSKRLVACGVQH